jgi:8-oxo-dGTP pyrophosphatase MutT (NUDIX family)
MTAHRSLRAVVTAGGTEESIDDVRVLSNVSSGRFGAAIARALDRRGVATTVLASRALSARPDELRGGVRTVAYRGFADLDRELRELEDDPPDLVFMAAAVSDFSPAPAAGKLPSDAATLDVHLTRNPKLLARLRAALGPRVVLVGFKLLSRVARAELERVARAQAVAASLDLTVANDLQELKEDQHPVLLVPPAGEARRVEGHREDVAEAIVDEALRILDARGRSSAAATRGVGVDGRARVEQAADRLGWRADERAMRTRADGERSLLLDTVAGVEAILAVDHALGRFDAVLAADAATSDEAIRAALAEAAARGRWNGGAFTVGIEGGGAFLGLDDAALMRLETGFEAAQEALATAGPLGDGERATARPILDGTEVAGVTVEIDGATAPFVAPSARRRGVGDEVARALVARGVPVVVDEPSSAFFVERGYLRSARITAAPLVALDPPDIAAGIPAASVALVDPLRRRVLLGRRRRAPYEGWWGLPGGRVAPGESARAAAARELAEETGITLRDELQPILRVPVLAGDGARVFAIESLAFLVLCADAPRVTDELEAAWVYLGAAADLRPMTAGTRLVLARLAARLGWR